MRNPAQRYSHLFLTVVATIVMAMPGAHTAAQDYASGNPDKHRACSNLGIYVFVGGTGGFDAPRHGDRFEELLKTGHVGLYEHANAIYAAQELPGLLPRLQSFPVYH